MSIDLAHLSNAQSKDPTEPPPRSFRFIQHHSSDPVDKVIDPNNVKDNDNDERFLHQLGVRDEEQALLDPWVEGLAGVESRSIDPKRSGWLNILGYRIPKPLAILLGVPCSIIAFLILRNVVNKLLNVNSPLPTLQILSNGTHEFNPTVILISLDGFKPSYFTTHAKFIPNLIKLYNQSSDDSSSSMTSGAAKTTTTFGTYGMRADMQPCFPTLTFPNHWSLMTGLYPESHGIVANDFWDPSGGVSSWSGAEDGSGLGIRMSGPPMTTFREKGLGSVDDCGEQSEVIAARAGERYHQGAEFNYTNHSMSFQPGWWWGEPIWSVVEKAGMRSLNIMWPGPPTTSQGISPTYFVPFQQENPSQKLKTLLQHLDLPLDHRPQLMTLYIPEIDIAGHSGGPESVEVEEALKLVDEFIGSLVDELRERSLGEIVDLLVVSDHGMTSTANERLIYLDDLLGIDGFDDIDRRDGWPAVGLRFKEGSDVDHYFDVLLEAAASSNGKFGVYTHNTMPDRWHFAHGSRIAPIYIVASLGWAITDHHEHEVYHQGDFRPKGIHGYDNIETDMQAIFVANGPFAKSVKSHLVQTGDNPSSSDPLILKPFRNLEIYSLVLNLLSLRDWIPPHNGTEGFWERYF